MLSYEHCRLCPRACGVDRRKGQIGFCGMTDTLKVARASLHFGEEPVISGHFGAGTVFFSGCNLRCGYCQNWRLSHEGLGAEVTSGQLRTLFLRLIDEGAENIELVTPTQFLPTILPALQPKLPVPVVYNCGGYESVEVLRQREGMIDVYLPDLKYSDKALARALSQAEDYPEVAQNAILEMYRQVGKPQYRDGILTKGVLVRHLVLPGNVGNSLGVLDWLSERFPKGEVLLSLMRQYTPMGRLKDVPPYDRAVTEEEYAAVRSWAELCGIKEGFFQEEAAVGQAYVPEFTENFAEL